MYVIEANPRASRTVPFVAKATGVPLAKVATRVMLGATLAELRTEGLLRAAVDARARRDQGGGAAVQPLPRGRHRARPGDALDRRGDGHRRHVRQGVLQGRAGRRHGAADRRARCSCRSPTATSRPGLVVAKRLRELGLGIAATAGTAAYLARFDQPVDLVVGKVSEGAELTAVDLIADGKVSFVINTPQGRGGRTDGEQIRKAANSNRVSSVTTVEAALAAVQGMAEQAGRPT